MKKWLIYVPAGLAGAVAIACAAIYAGSVERLGRTYDVALEPFDASHYAIDAGEAKRRATSLMCMGCHQKAGQAILSDKLVGTLVAPNLSRVARNYSDSELARLLRHGVKKDGTGVIAMPSANYANLADEDLAAIITWLRHLEPVPDALPNRTTWGPLGRVALATGKAPFDADRIPAAKAPARRPDQTGPYLVSVTCSHCHNLASTHDDGFGMVTPALAPVTKGYTFEQFDHLMQTGEAIGGRELPFMSEEARVSFSSFERSERQAIYDYLSHAGD